MPRSPYFGLMLLLVLATSNAFAARKIEGLVLRESEQALRQSILVQTPLGSSFEDVLRELQARGYVAIPSSHGLFRLDAEEHVKTFGVSSIRVELGDYWTFPFFATSVAAYWGFDAKGRLFDVWVWKGTEGP
jgi:hypothetical protein